jgi:hypothetical protein
LTPGFAKLATKIGAPSGDSKSKTLKGTPSK